MDIDPRDVVTLPVVLTGGAGSTAIKAGIAGLKWLVVSTRLVATANSTFKVLSGSTALTGDVVILAANPYDSILEPVWVATAAGDALNIDPGAGAIEGWVNVVMLK